MHTWNCAHGLRLFCNFTHARQFIGIGVDADNEDIVFGLWRASQVDIETTMTKIEVSIYILSWCNLIND